MKRTNIYIEPNQREDLKKIADHHNETGIKKWSMAEIVRRAVDEFVRKYFRKFKL